MTSAEPARPLALIDVDGVLNPYGAVTCPSGYAEHDLFPGEDPVRVCASHGPLLLSLAEHAELTWATSWDDNANRLLGPLLGLPELPYIPCFQPQINHYDKFPAIARGVGPRPLVWFDDLHSVQAVEWARHRAAPTRLIHVDPAVGLTGDDVELAIAFLTEASRFSGPWDRPLV
jgi:hypothetical protein